MEYALSELFTLQMGKTPSRDNSSYWKKSENNWISIADLTNSGKYISNTKETLSDSAVAESGIKKIPANTVIMSFKLSLGKVAITEKEMYSNEAIMAFIDKGVEKISPEYLYYLLRAKDWSKGTNKAVMGATLNKATLSTIKIQLHEYDNQLEIVNMLNRVSSSIDFRKQQLTKLDELIKARFVEMFGEPGAKNENWPQCTLGKACKINPKKSEDIRLQPNLEVSFVPMPAVTENGKMDSSIIKIYDEVKTGFTYFSERDVLFAKITPCMENGKGAVAVNLKNEIGFGSTEFHVIRPIAEKTNPYWIYALTVFEKFRKDAAKNMTGSAGQRRVPASFLENYQISLPPIDLQNQFAAFVAEVDKSKVEVQKALDQTQLLFDSLMQQYFG